jgi:hypothetical protein
LGSQDWETGEAKYHINLKISYFLRAQNDKLSRY